MVFSQHMEVEITVESEYSDLLERVEDSLNTLENFLACTFKNLAEFDTWKQQRLSNNLAICANSFYEKLDALARKYLCYANDLWCIQQWLNFSSTSDSETLSLLVEHQDIIDQAVYELHPRLITVLPIEESLFKHFINNDTHDPDWLHLAKQSVAGRAMIKQDATEIFYQTQVESELPEWIDEYAPFATEAVSLIEEYGQASYQNERREVVKWLITISQQSPFAKFYLIDERAESVLQNVYRREILEMVN